MADTMILKMIRSGKQMWFDFHNDIKYFSGQLAFTRLFETLLSKLPLKKSRRRITNRKNIIISAYLLKNFKEIIRKYQSTEAMEPAFASNTVWVFWWQGRQGMPVIVKKCVDSIYQHNKNRNIVLITHDNYDEYIKVPDYMFEKLNNGTMKTAHFSDYVRSFLIANYGGLWMDATLFCTQPVPNEVFEKSVYSGKSERIDSVYVSKYRWATFMFAGKKDNLLFQYLCDFFLLYWKKESIAIDYLFFDHIIDLAYNNIPLIKKQIDEIPVNTVHRDNLAAAFYEKYSPESYNEVFDDDTWFYKISWRENFPEVTANNEITNFNYFMNS